MLNFFSETEFTLPDQDFYRDWVHACVDTEGGKIGHVNVIFCDDDYLLEINQKHLNHDYYTDIITFDYSEEETLNGDIFISIDRIADNAFEYDAGFDRELARVLIHGFLHMLGYKDKTDEDQQKMTQKEDACLALLFHAEEEE